MAERYKDGDNIDLWLMQQKEPIRTDFALYLEEKERKAKAEMKKKTVKKTKKK